MIVEKSRAVGRSELLPHEMTVCYMGETRVTTFDTTFQSDAQRRAKRRGARDELKMWIHAVVPMHPDYARKLITAAGLPMPPHLIPRALTGAEADLLKELERQLFAGLDVPAADLKGTTGSFTSEALDELAKKVMGDDTNGNGHK